MKSKYVDFSASNAKRSVKFASVNENSLYAALVVCLLFERIANDLVNDILVYSLFASVLFANVNASLFALTNVTTCEKKYFSIFIEQSM